LEGASGDRDGGVMESSASLVGTAAQGGNSGGGAGCSSAAGEEWVLTGVAWRGDVESTEKVTGEAAHFSPLISLLSSLISAASTSDTEFYLNLLMFLL
jgi:hypothetical protein